MKNILITGGAGFIGSHLADELIRHDYEVIALDNLSEQVHGPQADRPEYLNDQVQLVRGDVRDESLVRRLVQEVDAVIHLAALVGVGQSMYEIRKYTEVNNAGTAVLLQALIDHPVKKLLVASSMSIYGEGPYLTPAGSIREVPPRSLEQLKSGLWELSDAEGVFSPVATPETKSPDLSSIYALSKFDQEKMCLITGRAYNIPTVALRFFNVYGTRQALSNPYTGVLAIFASRLLNDRPPLIFEDGNQRRDFVHVKDVARACRQVLESPAANGEAFNIGSGRSYTIAELAEKLALVMGKPLIAPQITHNYRVGDIRHCFADISKAQHCFHYRPMVPLDEGMDELVTWLGGQMAADHVDEAARELMSRGLTV